MGADSGCLLVAAYASSVPDIAFRGCREIGTAPHPASVASYPSVVASLQPWSQHTLGQYRRPHSRRVGSGAAYASSVPRVA
eukprot:789277-Rhodomonas_salina.4